MRTVTKPNWVLLLFMVAFCLAAFSANPLLHRDQLPPGVPHQVVRRLEAPASNARDGVHPHWMQTIVVEWSPDAPEYARGEVVYRTLFGIPVGTDVVGGGGIYHGLNPRAWLSVWLGFLLVEGVTGAYLLRRLIES